MAFHGLYFSPKSDVAASFRLTVAGRFELVSRRCGVPGAGCCGSGKTLTRQYSGKQIADVPVVVQSQVLVIQKMQKTVEVPQVQFVDKVPMFQKVQKTTEFPHVALIVRILDVHVVIQDKFSPAEQCRRGGFTGPVHRGMVQLPSWRMCQDSGMCHRLCSSTA